MTWEGFWWPQIAGALVGVGVTVLIGAPLGLIARHWWRGALQQLRVTATNALEGNVNASLAAQDASAVRSGQDDVARRLTGVEGAVEGLRDGVSASLGLRAREELRFRSIEQALGLPVQGEDDDREATAPDQEGDRRRGRRAADRPPGVGVQRP